MRNCLLSFLLIVIINIPNAYSQHDFIPGTIDEFYCQDVSGGSYSMPYFRMDNDTHKALVVFCNYPDEDFDIPGTVYLQYWPGSSHLTMPSWADSVICPTTTNVWDKSLTAYFRDASRGKFWLIGDVYPELYVFEHNYQVFSSIKRMVLIK